MSHFLEGHTVQRFDGELGQFHLGLLEMGGLALDQCREAIGALETGDVAKSDLVLARGHDLLSLERQLDQLALEILSRRAPVARDLRVIISFAKVVSELKQAGNVASEVAQFALAGQRTGRPGLAAAIELKRISHPALSILEEAVNLLDRFDTDLAETISTRHWTLESEFEASLRRLSTLLWEDARIVGSVIDVVLILRSLQWIGERSRNIRDYVLYAVTGNYPEREPSAGGESAGRRDS